MSTRADKKQLLHDLIDKAWEMGMRPRWDGGDVTRLGEIAGPGSQGWMILFQEGDDEIELRIVESDVGPLGSRQLEISWSAWREPGKHGRLARMRSQIEVPS